MEYVIIFEDYVFLSKIHIICNRCKEETVKGKRFIHLLLIVLCVKHFFWYFIFGMDRLKILFYFYLLIILLDIVKIIIKKRKKLKSIVCLK